MYLKTKSSPIKQASPTVYETTQNIRIKVCMNVFQNDVLAHHTLLRIFTPGAGWVHVEY